ncbi:MAG: LamG domain-containing protein [Bacteroidetes bacterium]|nr:LamG domain-containing protein [Bacteroidota bacterium]
MKFNNKISGKLGLFLLLGLALGACQKHNKPPLRDYPKDTYPVGSPLRFLAAMDGSNLDSIRNNKGKDNDVTYIDGGVSGKAITFDYAKKGYLAYPSANDFAFVNDFTISIWIKATLAQKDHVNADGVLALSNTKNFWSNICMFVDHETSTSDSMILKFHFNTANNGDNWDVQYQGPTRIPKMYDGQWHHIAGTYASSSKAWVLYIDGKQFASQTLTSAIKFENASQLVIGGFQEAAGIADTYDNNSWMAPFPGAIDNVRLYGTTLSATDVQALYTNKQ